MQVAIVANTFNGENDVGVGQTSLSDSQGSKFAYFPSSTAAVSTAPTELNTATENQDQQNVTGGTYLNNDIF